MYVCMYVCKYVLRLKRIVVCSIRIFFNYCVEYSNIRLYKVHLFYSVN